MWLVQVLMWLVICLLRFKYEWARSAIALGRRTALALSAPLCSVPPLGVLTCEERYTRTVVQPCTEPPVPKQGQGAGEDDELAQRTADHGLLHTCARRGLAHRSMRAPRCDRRGDASGGAERARELSRELEE